MWSSSTQTTECHVSTPTYVELYILVCRRLHINIRKGITDTLRSSLEKIDVGIPHGG